MGKLLEKLRKYGDSDFYPYHMPGHKRKDAGALPHQWIETDITEIEDFDNLHQAEGILKELQEDAAKAYGAEESFYLVNGSTCGILSAVSAAVDFGAELLICRNCHKSVYHAAYLRHLKLDYIYPETVDSFGISEAVTVTQVEEALREYPQASAVLIVSPTYEGRIADIRAIAETVHGKGLPLIVDEAHGAHLGFSEEFALNSCRLGADLVINSVHKTLPSMTQTALLHCNGSLVDRDRLKRFLHIYQSSSPSYVLMASIEEAVRMAAEKKEAFADFAESWKQLLKMLEGCKHLRILPVDEKECEKKVHDIGKLVISVKGTGLSGRELYDILLNKYHLQMEMMCADYVLAMFTLADTKDGYERLAEALLEIDAGLENGAYPNSPDANGTGPLKKAESRKQRTDATELRPTAEKPFYEAWDRETEQIRFEESKERVAGEFVNLYPPGTPILVPGERISAVMLDCMRAWLSEGLSIQGISENGYITVWKQ